MNVLRIQIIAEDGKILTTDDQLLNFDDFPSDETQVIVMNTSHMIVEPDGSKNVIGTRTECFRIPLPEGPSVVATHLDDSELPD